MGSITTMTVFVWTVNVLIFMAQIAVTSINPAGNIFYSSNNTVISYYTDGDSMPSDDKIQSDLDITSSSDVSEGSSGSGIFFIDAIASIKAWFQRNIARMVSFVKGPYIILNSIPGLPKQAAALLSLVWYGSSLMLLLLTIFGRNT